MDQFNEYTDWEHPSIKSVFKLATLDENDQFPLELIRKTPISPDTYQFEFKYPDPEW